MARIAANVQSAGWKRWFVGIAVIVAMALVLGRGGDSTAPPPAGRDVGAAHATRAASSSTTAERGRAIPALSLAIVVGELRLEGQAVDSDGHPIGGARVTLDGTRTTTSELDGSFGFDGLADGTYTVSAETDELYGEDAEVRLDDTSDPVSIRMTSGPAIVVHVVEHAGLPVRVTTCFNGGSAVRKLSIRHGLSGSAQASSAGVGARLASE